MYVGKLMRSVVKFGWIYMFSYTYVKMSAMVTRMRTMGFPNKHGGGEERGGARGEDNKKLRLLLFCSSRRRGHIGAQYGAGARPNRAKMARRHGDRSGPSFYVSLLRYFARFALYARRVTAAV